MDNFNTSSFDIYKDISARTKGEIYLGIIGAVRTGKSTFIKRFMEQMVLPYMDDEHDRERTIDEMPQSAAGKTIMTTEPKFIPKEAAQITLEDGTKVKVRLIDCVGYMVEGASGHMENDAERMVKTPWFDYEVPFTQAAEIGTKKVISEHSTIGIVIASDGSFTDIPRENYAVPEEKTVLELKSLGKPFIILLNSTKPYSDETKKLAEQMQEKYQVSVMPVNCEQLKREDISRILQAILYEFPVVQMNFYMPKWVEMLEYENPIKQNIIQNAGKFLRDITYVKDFIGYPFETEGDYIEQVTVDKMDLATGSISLRMEVQEKYYYENMSELTGVEIHGEYQLISLIRELAGMKKEYEKVEDAMNSVKMKGYGVVNPGLSDITLEEPVLIKHGSKYGVKMKAISPSIHMIKANIETEVAPIVGNEEQAKDLIEYIKDSQNTEEGVWNTNIFGKSIGELMEDGIKSKISMMDDESQLKLQDTMQKIVNDSNGGLVCIII